MKTNKEVLKIARSHLGQGGARFRKYVGLPAGSAWCNAFVDYVANEGGVKSLYFNGKKETYCPHSIQWCKKNLAEIPLYLALPMDIIYFDWDKNGNPNHIGLVRAKRNTASIYTTEGNTDKKNKEGKTVAHGVVADRVRPAKYVQGIYRPHYVPSGCKKKKLSCNGNFGYHSIYNLQIALGMKPNGILTKETVKFLQKRAKATEDGSWGRNTSLKVQKMVGAKQDGEFGKNSVIALQKWINGINYPPKPKKPSKPKETAQKTTKKPDVKKDVVTKKPATTSKEKKEANASVKKKTNQQKLLDEMKKLAWAYGTAKKKYAYKTGNPKKVCKEAMKKYKWADNKAEMSDCGNFVSTVVRESGVDKSFKALHGVKTPFPKTEKKFNIVLKGKEIPKGFLKPGDIIRYKKKNGKQHAMFYYGDGKVCEASHHNLFGVIRKDTKRYNTQSKHKTIQVLRAKEK